MWNLVKRWLQETHALIWTLSGTCLVLITLSGVVLRYAVWISITSVVLHFVGFAFTKDDDDEETS